MAGLKLDDVLTGLAFEGDRCVCRFRRRRPRTPRSASASTSPFRELVVFTPPFDTSLIAVEPYTQATDAINLQARGVDAGLRVLGHGESKR